MWKTSRLVGSWEDVNWSCGCQERGGSLVVDCLKWHESKTDCHRLYYMSHGDSFK